MAKTFLGPFHTHSVRSWVLSISATKGSELEELLLPEEVVAEGSVDHLKRQALQEEATALLEAHVWGSHESAGEGTTCV